MNTCNTGWNGTTCWPNTNGFFTGVNGAYGCFPGASASFIQPTSPFGNCTPSYGWQGTTNFCPPIFGSYNNCSPTWTNSFVPSFAPSFGGTHGWNNLPGFTPSYAPTFGGFNGLHGINGFNGLGFNSFANPWGFTPNGCIGSACPDYTGVGCCLTGTNYASTPAWGNGFNFNSNPGSIYNSTPSTIVQTCFGPTQFVGGTQCVPTIGCGLDGTPICGIVVNGCFIPGTILAGLLSCIQNCGHACTQNWSQSWPQWCAQWSNQFGAQWSNQWCSPATWSTPRSTTNVPYGVPTTNAPIGTPTHAVNAPVNPYAAAVYGNGAKPFTGSMPNPYATPVQGVPSATGAPGFPGADCCQPLSRNAA